MHWFVVIHETIIIFLTLSYPKNFIKKLLYFIKKLLLNKTIQTKTIFLNKFPTRLRDNVTSHFDGLLKLVFAAAEKQAAKNEHYSQMFITVIISITPNTGTVNRRIQNNSAR